MYSIYILLPVTILLTTAVLAFMHMLAPDHWTPILSYSLKNKVNRKKTGVISLYLGFLHGLFSALLSLLIVFIGIYFFPTYYVRIFSILLLVFIAIYIIINAHFENENDRSISRSMLLVSVIPDPAIVPFILLAIIYGVPFVYTTVVLFIVISTISLFIVTIGLSNIIKSKINKITPKNVDYLVSLILLLTAIFIVV